MKLEGEWAPEQSLQAEYDEDLLSDRSRGFIVKGRGQGWCSINSVMRRREH